jgi:hypothetical protein
MDPTLSTVLITVITGVFSVITLLINRNQNKLEDKLDEQNIVIEREKVIRQKLVQSEKKRDAVVQKMTILSLKVNVLLLTSLRDLVDQTVIDDLKATSKELETTYKDALNEIKSVSDEYDMLLSVSKDLKEQMAKSKR